MTEVAAKSTFEHPSGEELLEDFGGEYLSIQSLFRFCFVPGGRLSFLRELALEEHWGENNFALLKYLATQVRLSIEQSRYVWNGDQIVLTAGRLTTPTGTPIYLGLVKNSNPEDNPWVLNWVGERPSCTELPEPPDLGTWPALDPGAEPILAFDLRSEDRRLHLPVIEDLPVAAQLSAIAGSLSWSARRGLAVRQLHGAGHGYFVPLFLDSREDLTGVPDLVAPVQVQPGRLVVRTLLEPHVAYAPARAVVERWEQLAPWLLESWDAAGEAGAVRES